MTSTAAALFAIEGNVVTPTEYARGPWDPAALHGGPVAALLARAVEAIPADMPMDVARLTVELLRPVPREPLHVAATVARPGRKVQLAEATLTVGSTGVEVARARALRIRRAEVPLPHDDAALAEHLELEPAPPGPEGAPRERSRFSGDYVAFHTASAEHRFVAGSWAEVGPVTVWIRLLVRVVPGEQPTPLQRTVAAADFANGVARVLPFETHVFINPDLTVHLFRPPEGEWIGMASRSHIGAAGCGMAESALFDVRARIGRAVQSLLVEAR